MTRLEFTDVTIVYHHHYVFEAPTSLARSQNIYRIVHMMKNRPLGGITFHDYVAIRH